MQVTSQPLDDSGSPEGLDAWLLENLVCPRDRFQLIFSGGQLLCRDGHAYPVIQGIPVMLLEGVPDTLGVMSATVARTRKDKPLSSSRDDLYLETVGISDDEREGILRLAAITETGIDPVVNYLVAATNGIMYKQLIGQLQTYPIPELDLPEGKGRLFLDIGCSWGRWCIAAARKGYSPVGLDPSLGAVMAARRVAAQLKLPLRFVVGDARYLPFKDESFETVFSYSVIQHFSYDDASQTIREASRVLVRDGKCLIQLPNAFGLRCLYHQARRAFRTPQGFEVRYWTPKRMERAFRDCFQLNSLSADCFFGIGLQASDVQMMPVLRRMVIHASELAKMLSKRIPILARAADSIWINGAAR
jgi:SAM-dependent methyltransferase/uncharacterized protein YbaR (Trm112 family)